MRAGPTKDALLEGALAVMFTDIEGCAELLARLDHCDEAAELLAAADNLRTGTRRAASDQLRYEATLALCEYRLDDTAFASASKRGAALAWRAAADTALRFLGRD